MAFLNEQTNELHLKVLYAGCAGAGKTTNLQSLFKQTSGDIAARLFDLAEIGRRGQPFDFLPLAIGEARAHALRLHAYTLPTHDLWPTVNRNLACGVDGAVFVLDSRLSAIEENVRHLARLKALLASGRVRGPAVPLVLQLNHRDAADALPVRALREQFASAAAAVIETVAVQDIGVLETVESLSELILEQMEQPRPQAQREGHAFA